MSWITIIWSMEAAVCLTLAGIHFMVWLKARHVWGHLFFSFSAVASAMVAACELVLLRTNSVERYGSVMWLTHIPIWVLVVSVVWFTRFHLRAGWPWMGWAATAPDRRRVAVGVRHSIKQIEVVVSDAGPGIPADKLPHLFEPFFTSKENGMGLGLPISRTIIEAHGGSIRAHNNPDGGAIFLVTLPVANEGSIS